VAPNNSGPYSYASGLQASTDIELWIAGLSGDYREGVLYWAGQRSTSHPGSCTGTPDFQRGCREAQAKFALPDYLRKEHPEYKKGWNAYVENALPAASTPPTAPSSQPPVPATSPMYQKGLQDRTAYEQWIATLSGDMRTGAEFWAGQRSLKVPGSCYSETPQFTEGCQTAKVRLDPTDVLRGSNAEYKAGWNAYKG
jgi:hypothetical protein